MPEYRLVYERMGGEDSDVLTKEFQADDDETARRVYEEFDKATTAARDSGKYYCYDYARGLYRIDQREKLTQIC